MEAGEVTENGGDRIRIIGLLALQVRIAYIARSYACRMRGFNELLLHPVETDVTEEKGNSKSIIEIDSRMNMLTGVKLRWPRITRIKTASVSLKA